MLDRRCPKCSKVALFYDEDNSCFRCKNCDFREAIPVMDR